MGKRSGSDAYALYERHGLKIKRDTFAPQQQKITLDDVFLERVRNYAASDKATEKATPKQKKTDTVVSESARRYRGGFTSSRRIARYRYHAKIRARPIQEKQRHG